MTTKPFDAERRRPAQAGSMDERRLIGGVAALRAAFGCALAVATPALLERMIRPERPSGTLVVFARTLGIRNLVFGLSGLAASRGGDTREMDRWTRAWLASDVADIITAVTAGRHIGRVGATRAAVIPIPFALSGIWALRRTVAARRATNGAAPPAAPTGRARVTPARHRNG